MAIQRRYAAIEVTRDMMFDLLHLPSSSKVIDVFVDPWSKNLIFTVEDEAIAPMVDGERLKLVAVTLTKGDVPTSYVQFDYDYKNLR